jgi:hypothetical protein
MATIRDQLVTDAVTRNTPILHVFTLCLQLPAHSRLRIALMHGSTQHPAYSASVLIKEALHGSQQVGG